jgi:hypothetical protein
VTEGVRSFGGPWAMRRLPGGPPSRLPAADSRATHPGDRWGPDKRPPCISENGPSRPCVPADAALQAGLLYVFIMKLFKSRMRRTDGLCATRTGPRDWMPRVARVGGGARRVRQLPRVARALTPCPCCCFRPASAAAAALSLLPCAPRLHATWGACVCCVAHWCL